MNELKKITSICTFCYSIVDDYICWTCNDYKGVMSVKDAEDYLKEDLTDYLI